MFLESKWWEFCIVALFIFLVCVAVNYLLKKVNEAKIEERLSRLLQKTSVSTQVQEPILAIESIKTKPKITGISLVFNKEENMLLGIKRKASTLLAKKSKSKNLEEILELTQDEENALYHKISIISVDKNKTNQVHTKYTFAETRNMIIKDSNDICVSNSSSSRLTVKPKEFIQKVSSGSIKLLNIDCKLNLSKCKNTRNNIGVINSDNLVDENADVLPTIVDPIKAISQELSSSDLTSLRLEAKSANYKLECSKLDKVDETKNNFEPCGSNLIDILKQEMWHHASSLTKSEFGLINSNVNDSDTDNYDSVVSKISSSKDKRSKEDTQETKEMLSHIISSHCLTTHKLEAKSGKANISTKNPGNSELDILVECHESNNVSETNSKIKVTVNPILHTDNAQPGENDQVSLLKRSMWHPNNCLTTTNSYIPCKSKEIVNDFVIDTGEIINQIVTLKNVSQTSYVSTNCQRLPRDLTEDTHLVMSHEIKIIDSSKNTCSNSRALPNNSKVDLFQENVNDNDPSTRDGNKELKSLENNGRMNAHRASCENENNDNLKKLSENST